ncbi:MAG: prepilin peptidase [Trueperaceae bacterium]|nr:prepilin peptidase [Trueperaceae bacterium]
MNGPWVWAYAGILGAFLGSFANVVVHRLPRGGSVAWPGSRCPTCDHPLSPRELVPLLSWLALRGRCRHCGAPISLRYPVVEALAAAGFVALAVATPLPSGLGVALALGAIWIVLLSVAFVDLAHAEIPDVLTLPPLAAALLAAAAFGGARPVGPALPDLTAAAWGAAFAAGVLVLVDRLGGLALRRGRDTRERLWPLGFDQVAVAAVAGAAGGLAVGLLAAGASIAVNLASRRTLRVAEPVAWTLWLAALLASPVGVGPLAAIAGSVGAAGTVALAGGAVWWLVDLRRDARGGARGAPAPDDGADEPIAMGFGDVKLAGLLGAVLGVQGAAVALLAAVAVGAVVGVAHRLAGGGRAIPFGPWLVVGGLVALLVGDAAVAAYLGWLGLR